MAKRPFLVVMRSFDWMIDPAAPVDLDPCQAGEGFRVGAGEAAAVAALIQRKPRRIDSTDARTMDNTSAFDRLLQGAAAQPEPQRLLFVFATAELPDDATPAQRERYAAGGGGTLAPVICVDKGLDDLTGFDALVAESREADAPWHVVFAAGLSGRNGQSPSAEQVDLALQTMVERVRGGNLESFLALDKSGEALQFV